jgi:histone-lysine N-methyltransferase SETMAR
MCHCILSDEIGMRLITAKFMPRLLTDNRKQHRLEVSLNRKEHVSNDPDLLSKVITGDESWIDDYDPEIKQQSSQWKCPSSPWLKKTLQVKSNVTSLLICFFDSDRIIHKEFVPPG